jgi:hypothetical protein
MTFFFFSSAARMRFDQLYLWIPFCTSLGVFIAVGAGNFWHVFKQQVLAVVLRFLGDQESRNGGSILPLHHLTARRFSDPTRSHPPAVVPHSPSTAALTQINGHSIMLLEDQPVQGPRARPPTQ